MNSTNRPPAPAGRPTLTVSLAAWTHWQLLTAHHTEVTALGLAGAADPLRVEALYVPAQECTDTTTHPADTAFADAQDWALDDMGVPDEQVSRIGKLWLHTHPQMSARPSCVDEDTFATRFTRQDYAVMAIHSKTGDRYARLQERRFGLSGEMDFRFDFSAPVDPAVVRYLTEGLAGRWAADLAARVSEPPPVLPQRQPATAGRRRRGKGVISPDTRDKAFITFIARNYGCEPGDLGNSSLQEAWEEYQEWGDAMTSSGRTWADYDDEEDDALAFHEDARGGREVANEPRF